MNENGAVVDSSAVNEISSINKVFSNILIWRILNDELFVDTLRVLRRNHTENEGRKRYQDLFYKK